MGTNILSSVLNGELTAEDIRLKMSQQIDADRIHYGQNRYSGAWNTITSIRVLNKIFDGRRAVDEWCEENVEKCEAVAAQFKSYDIQKFEQSPKAKAIIEKISEANKKHVSAIDAATKALKETKSKTIACEHCESRITRSYLRNHNCPVCNHKLFSKSTIDKLEKLASNTLELRNKLEEMKQEEMKKNGVTKWLIFACASI